MAAGLQNNEACMWVTSSPLMLEEARHALGRALPDFGERCSRGQIEILPHTEWYLQGGAFDLNRVLNGWIDRLDCALSAGYSGAPVLRGVSLAVNSGELVAMLGANVLAPSNRSASRAIRMRRMGFLMITSLVHQDHNIAVD